MKVKLPDVCNLQYGFPFDSGKFCEGEGTPLIRIRDVKRGFTETYTTEQVPEEYMIQAGEILIGMDGEFNLSKWNSAPAALNQRVCHIAPKAEIISDFLYYALPPKIKRIEEKTSFVTVKHLSSTALNAIELDLPTRAEQQQIATILNSIAALIKKRKQQLSALDTLIKARFVEMFGDPIENPLGWSVKTLKELATLITNGNTPKGGSENYVDDGVIFLRSQNVWRNLIDLSDVVYIDKNTHASMKKSSVHHNDILITKTGRINTENSSLGRASLYSGSDNSANINGHVYLIRLCNEAVPMYVVTILTGEAYRKYIRKVCVGGIDKRQINLDQVEKFPIIVPPKGQQEEFSRFATQVDKSKVVVQKYTRIIRHSLTRGLVWRE